MRISKAGWCLIACLAVSQSAAGEVQRQHPRDPFGAAGPNFQPRVTPRAGIPDEMARPRALKLAPVIESLTPDHGRQGDVIVISGANFPAPNYDPQAGPNPLDPGFAKVRLGNWVAQHVEITSTRLWVSVPKMPEGAVLVTIQTRFGFSNAVHFTVERAWWDFWSPKPGQ